MTRLGLSLILVVLIISSCQKDTRPPDVLSKEDYAALLTEVYLTEARLNQLHLPSDSTMRLYLAHEPQLLKKYGVAEETLKKTYEDYVKQPNDLEAVYAA